MNTIVMNLQTGFVSEYDWTFQSITPTHAGDTTGLFELGGDSDGTMGDPPVPVSIDATFLIGRTLLGSSLKKALGPIFISVQGTGAGLARVAGQSKSWEYAIAASSKGESRATPGKGIRENYLAFGYRNVDGANFRIDRIEATVIGSKNRRTS